MTDAADVAQLRQGLYRFFAEALTHPNTEQLGTLEVAAAYLRTLAIADYAYFGAWARLDALFMEGVDPASLDVEYVRLFASGTDGALCPPIESFYVSRAEGGGIAGTVAAIQRTYGELGVDVGDAESPDHVSSELNALSALCGREVDRWSAEEVGAATRLLSQENLFLRAHLMSWFPQFRRRVRMAAGTGFYAVVVEAVHAFLVHDVDWTRALVTRMQAER